MDMQAVVNYENIIKEFENKINNLKISKIISLQMAPQIKILQNNDKAIYNKIDETLITTIPIWKMQTTMAIGLQKQKNILNAQKQVENITEDLIIDNSENLNTLTQNIHENVVPLNIDKLVIANKNLLNNINQSLELTNQVEEEKQKIINSLYSIEDSIKNVLKNNKENN